MSRTVWIVAGASGFLGRRAIAELELDATIATVAVGRSRPFGESTAGTFEESDLTNKAEWDRILDRFAPAVVLNLAGRTPPADAEALFRDNVALAGALVRSLEAGGRPVRLVHAGSAAELGDVPSNRLPVGEDYDPKPVSDYGRAKREATEIVMSAKAPIVPVVGRLFNLIGPGQPSGQIFGRYARELARMNDLERKSFSVSGLDHRRDFIDVLDAARALVTLAREGRGGSVYHVGTGESRSIGEGLAKLAILSGRLVEFRPDTQALPNGPADSRADIGRIVRETSWRPRRKFEESLTDLWREASRDCLKSPDRSTE